MRCLLKQSFNDSKDLVCTSLFNYNTHFWLNSDDSGHTEEGSSLLHTDTPIYCCTPLNIELKYSIDLKHLLLWKIPLCQSFDSCMSPYAIDPLHDSLKETSADWKNHSLPNMKLINRAFPARMHNIFTLLSLELPLHCWEQVKHNVNSPKQSRWFTHLIA